MTLPLQFGVYGPTFFCLAFFYSTGWHVSSRPCSLYEWVYYLDERMQITLFIIMGLLGSMRANLLPTDEEAFVKLTGILPDSVLT